MGKRCVIASCFWLGVFITSIHSLEEGKDNTLPADIIIADNKSLKKIEIRKPSNSASSLPETSTVIQQGNNVYIKPKFIFGSQFNSYRQGSISDNNCCNDVSVTSKLPDEETNIVIKKPTAPQVPILVVPPLITPPNVEDDVVILPPKFPTQPETPVIPNPPQNKSWLKVPNDCPPFVTPMSPNSPQLPKFLTDKRPNRLEVIPKPPELPPLILPKLPIQVIFRRPVITKLPDFTLIPQQPIDAPPLCPPLIKCILPEKNLPSTPDIFSTMFENFKNIRTLPNRMDLSKILVQDEKDLTPDFPLAYPTMCAQGIIAERVIPNIVENNDVKVIMIPISPSQFRHTGFYQE